MRHAPLDPSDWPALAHVLGESFGIPPERWAGFRARMGDSNLRTVHVGGRVAGGLGVYRMGQVFAGNRVNLGGFAGVGVSPQFRGAGVAAAMMTAAMTALREQGVPLAGLFASTQSLYRSVGFEQAGDRVRWKVPIRAIAERDRALAVWPVRFEPLFEGIQTGPAGPAADDPPADLDLLRGLYAPEHGNLDRNDAMWDRLAQFPDGTSIWLVGPREAPEGYVIFAKQSAGLHYTLQVRDWQARTPRAWRRLLALAADHSSLGEELRWYGPASDPLLALLPEQTAKVDEVQRWMIRILDVRGALEARGWSADGELHLHVDDPLFPENTGPWIVAVHQGVAAVRPGGTGALRTGIRGLAPLYTALFTPQTLARIGWIEADESTLQLAARLFSAPAPWMPDMY